jgi:hypothetical protein
MTFIEVLKDLKFLITTISFVVVFSVSGYLKYHSDLRQLELTQLSILKSQIAILEDNPCKTSRDEWADYEMLFSQYQTLMKKHNPLLKESKIKPMERLKKDSCACYKGDCHE